MLRASPGCLAINWGKSAVIGADLPAFQRYPYRGRDVLRLYRKFWGLVQRLPAEEQKDAAFRLRNEFRSKRHAYGEKRLGKLYQQGEARYEALKETLDAREHKATGLVKTAPRPQTPGAFAVQRQGSRSRTKLDGVTVDGMWASLKSHGQGFVPNLRNVPESKRVSVRAGRFAMERQPNSMGNNHSSR
uniref:Uncharacterized protein n=1 Tax=Neobodo designis TaxID=312471 RepID=A0A7S1Q2K5_NEODS|mmetsp:Transcript_28449/g.88187  ORF Transcript_28449/g.88187 Transcript_28449/m.88187 type:complete len:188 (+) Transcript_28449:50-613(+)